MKRAENRLAVSPNDPQLKAEVALRQADVKSFLELTEETRLARVASLQRRTENHARSIQQLTTELFDTTTLRAEFIRLKEDEQRMLAQVQDLRSRATSIDRFGTDMDLFNIIQLGGGDARPVGPNRPYMLLTGFAIGGLLGLLAVGLRARFGGPRGPRGPGNPGALAPSTPALAHG